MIPPHESSIRKEEEEKNDRAALLPVDPSAAAKTEALPHDAGFDWNGGIRADCQWCGGKGFIYWNESLGITLTLCDACRDDLGRRTRLASRRAEIGSGTQAALEPALTTDRSAAQKTSINDQAEGAEGR